MESKNFKRALGLGISGLMAISSFNLVVFAGVDNENEFDSDNVEKGISKRKIKMNDQSDDKRVKLEDEAKESLDIDEANFPDPIFRREVIKLLNVYNNREDIREGQNVDMLMFENIREICVYRLGIKDLTGIEHFRNLEKLDCHINKLEKLDVAKNVKLEILWCYENNLTDLDVANNVCLTDLNCSNNPLRKLNVAKNVNLEKLYCDENDLDNLDVANNVKLTELWCTYNDLMNLNVEKNVNLTELWCSNNDLRELNVSGLEKLCYINAKSNENLRQIIAKDCPNLGDVECDESCNIIED